MFQSCFRFAGVPVNNLISGVVIAFEKPVNVGDIVEFGGRTGTMKSIGIRSTVITTPG